MELQWCVFWASPIQNIAVACLLLFVVSLAPQLYVGTAWQRHLDDTARLFTDVAFSTVLVATLEVIAGALAEARGSTRLLRIGAACSLMLVRMLFTLRLVLKVGPYLRWWWLMVL